jgi:hypothetical protein
MHGAANFISEDMRPSLQRKAQGMALSRRANACFLVFEAPGELGPQEGLLLENSLPYA